MMHNPAIPRSILDRLNVFPGRNFQRKDEITIDIVPFGHQFVGFGHREHDIGLSEFPIVAKLRRRGKIFRCPFHGSLFDPTCEQRDLCRSQPAHADKVPMPLNALPGRHDLLGDHGLNLFGSFFHIGIAQ